MSDNHLKKHRYTGFVLMLIGLSLIAFSFMINVIDNKHILASGMFQFLEFSSGCLLTYSGVIFIRFAPLSHKEIFVRIALPILSTAFSVIVLELALQLILPQPQFDTRLMLYPHINRQLRVDLPGVAPLVHYSTNRQGLRGDEPPDVWGAYHTIITIGGSTTHSGFIDDAQTWSALLQSNLNESMDSVWVANAGIDGHSTHGHLIMMEEIISEVQPDMVIFLVGINDLVASLSNETSLYGTADDFREAPLLFKSYLFRLVWQLGHLLTGNVVTTQTAHKAFVPVAINPDELTALPDDLYDLVSLADSYRANLNQIIDIGEELNLEMLFLTQPLVFDDTPYWQGLVGNTTWIREQNVTISAATYWNLLDIFNGVLLEVCEERDVPCYDLASRVPHNDDYFYDIVHFNEAGSVLVADEITAIVEDILSD